MSDRNTCCFSRVVVIGSEGFIGRHLFKYLESKKYEVWGADVIERKPSFKNYFLINQFDSDFNIVFKRVKFDLCVNCSGAASVAESIINPSRDYHQNTINVFRILDSIKRYQPGCRYINLSSAAVYGDPKTLPVKEDAEISPITPYGFHKYMAELICKEFTLLYGMQTCSLRIFSAYGPGLKKQLFWDLFQKTRKDSAISIYGNGNESRDFIYIADLVRAIELVGHSSSFNADIINVANGEEVSIRDAVSMFFGMFDRKVIYSFSGDIRKGDPVNWLADINKLISLGYKPAVDMKTGLKQYFEWVTGDGTDMIYQVY